MKTVSLYSVEDVQEKDDLNEQSSDSAFSNSNLFT